MLWKMKIQKLLTKSVDILSLLSFLMSTLQSLVHRFLKTDETPSKKTTSMEKEKSNENGENT